MLHADSYYASLGLASHVIYIYIYIYVGDCSDRSTERGGRLVEAGVSTLLCSHARSSYAGYANHYRLHHTSLTSWASSPNSRVRNRNGIFYFSASTVWFSVGRDGSVCITTRYGLHSPGFESQCGFPHPSRLTLKSTKPPVQEVFTGDKAAGAWG
jgi:hypothetical protein